MLDRIKKLGFTYSTRGGITVGFQDIQVPAEKKQMIADAEVKIVEIDELFRMVCFLTQSAESASSRFGK